MYGISGFGYPSIYPTYNTKDVRSFSGAKISVVTPEKNQLYSCIQESAGGRLYVVYRLSWLNSVKLSLI